MNIADLITRQALLNPTAPAIVEGDRITSYGELDRLISRMAAGLVGSGVTDGDRVGLCLKDRSEFLACFLAAAKVGAIALIMDWRTVPSARTQIAKAFDVALVVREPDMPDLPGVPCVAIEDLTQRHTGKPSPVASAPGGGRPQTIVSSSGTTGSPKGLLVTHNQWIARMQTKGSVPLASPDIRFLSVSPLSFASNLSSSLYTLSTGKTLILYPPLFAPEELVEAIERYRPDTLFLVPTMVRYLLKIAGQGGMLLPKLRNLIIGGAALHPTEKHEIARRLALNVYDRFGAAGVGTISYLHSSQFERYGRSVGRLVRGVKAEVVDAEDRPVSTGKVGRLRCSGPTITAGWVGAVVEDQPEFLRNGWYYTSDLASFDSEGFLYIEGRASDLINRGGATIYPAEVEGVLLEHPAVREVAVLGRSAGNLGEEVVAFLVLQRPIDTGLLIGHCRDRLAPHKVPRQIIVRGSLPKTNSGKIRKRDLASLLRTD
jgi:acyl-coenzyme A synthetase/AMP-(fatty) acid ligase